MATEELELLSGTVDLLVLRTLAWGPQHGFAIAKWELESAAPCP